MTAGRPLRLAASVLVLACSLSPLRADTTPAKAPLWDPPRVSSPDNVDELKALQDRVKQVVDKVSPSVVGILIGPGAGSGVIVSDDGLVLTAAHVIGRPGAPLKLVLSDGTVVNGKSLGLNHQADSGMVKITDKVPKDAAWPGAKDGKWPAAKLGKSKALKRGQWVVSLGHPGGPKKDRRPPVRVGRFETYSAADTSLRTDCTLVGGDSGGPLFDLNGDVVGINSRIGVFIDYNIHVPVEAFQDQWAKLLKGDVIGGESRAELGIELDDADDARIKAVTPDGPADKAGLKAGDVITLFDGDKVSSADELIQLIAAASPGKTVEVEVQRGGKTVELKVTLGDKQRKRRNRP